VKAFCAGEPLEISGEHVSWSGFSGAPRSVQRPHPPIMIGGGSRRVLELAAREADVVSLNFNNRSGVIGKDGVQSSTAEGTAAKVAWVREAAGERYDDIELEIGAYFTFVQADAENVAAGIGGAFGLSTEDMLRHPHGLFGTPDEICQELERRREAYDLSYITVGDDVAEAFAPVVKQLAGR
jgi:alkanesulfonate monooxygenase SsuD/methylene tetrahydromethanopterin reductase-like flavin-dependent oxidoreductase (luciferase family)